jgi:hypothetical protein
MAKAKRVQLRRVMAIIVFILMLVIGLALFVADAHSLLGPSGTDPTNGEIKDTAKSPVMLWCLGWPIALTRRTVPVGVAFIWTLGCVLAWVHIAVAFHLGHGWSHEAAWEHTRKVGGYGDGIFVNYAFALVWLVDVLWAWAAVAPYGSRPRWLNWTIHGFLAFVVFNAAVVFGSPEMRTLFAEFFGAGLLLAWIMVRRKKKSSASPPLT